MKLSLDHIEGCFVGLAVGDALGVPVEFHERSVLKRNPVKTMTGFGTWRQPVGTWSDDSSLTFCLAESLLKGYDLEDVGASFVKWMTNGYWGAHRKVFDIGGTTRTALGRILDGEDPHFSGEFDVESNGNGSLMRIVPASIYFFKNDSERLMERMKEISGVTHAHFRSVFSCFIFSKFVSAIIDGYDKKDAYTSTMKEVAAFASDLNINPTEYALFKRIIDGALLDAHEDQIFSEGYVIHTLEASLWSFMICDSFEESVLRAVNLGGDTDTTGCVTGAIAGLYYGSSGIPTHWKSVLARHEDITTLAKKFKNCVEQL